MTSSTREEELQEIDRLLTSATFPGIKKALQSYRATVVASLPPPAPLPSKDDGVKTESPAPTANSTSSSSRATNVHSSSGFIPIDSFSWDQGSGYSSPTVTVYCDLEGVGEGEGAKDRVSCVFTKHGFELTVNNLNGKSYKLVKDNLEKDIVPEECKFIVKKNKVVLKLQKKKGEYEHWSQLTAKKPRGSEESKKDPSAGIMDMMKELYDSGDDQMRKIIGESMMKSRSGEKMEPSSDLDKL